MDFRIGGSQQIGGIIVNQWIKTDGADRSSSIGRKLISNPSIYNGNHPRTHNQGHPTDHPLNPARSFRGSHRETRFRSEIHCGFPLFCDDDVMSVGSAFTRWLGAFRFSSRAMKLRMKWISYSMEVRLADLKDDLTRFLSFLSSGPAPRRVPVRYRNTHPNDRQR